MYTKKEHSRPFAHHKRTTGASNTDTDLVFGMAASMASLRSAAGPLMSVSVALLAGGRSAMTALETTLRARTAFKLSRTIVSLTAARGNTI